MIETEELLLRDWRVPMERLGMKRRPGLDYDDPRFPDLNPTIVHAIRQEAWRG